MFNVFRQNTIWDGSVNWLQLLDKDVLAHKGELRCWAVVTNFPLLRKWSWSSCQDSSGTSAPSRPTTFWSTCSSWWWRIMAPCWRLTRWRASGTMRRSWSFFVPRNLGNLSDSGQRRQFVVSLGFLLSNLSSAENLNIFCKMTFQVLHVPAQHALLGRPGPLRPGAGEEESLPAVEC